MNKAQAIVKEYMDRQIDALAHGMHNLKEHEQQPTREGSLYNGMLKNMVGFEKQHMENLRSNLLKILE